MPRTALPFAFALLLSLTARAEAPAANIGLQIQVIAASTAKEAADPKLKGLQKRLDELRLPFQSFKLIGEKEMLLALDKQGAMDLPGGRRLDVQPRRFEDGGKLLLGLHLKGKSDVQLVAADAAIDPGGDIFVALATKDQGTLLVFVRHSRTSTP